MQTSLVSVVFFTLCKMCVRLQELKSDGVAACGTSGSGTPQVVSSSVRILAQALAHIEQGIERRFLKAPLGESLCWPGKVWNSLEKCGRVCKQSGWFCLNCELISCR